MATALDKKARAAFRRLSADMNGELHATTVRIICTMRGYAPEEVESWIDETSDDHDPDTASEYASVSSILIDYAEALRK